MIVTFEILNSQKNNLGFQGGGVVWGNPLKLTKIRILDLFLCTQGLPSSQALYKLMKVF